MAPGGSPVAAAVAAADAPLAGRSRVAWVGLRPRLRAAGRSLAGSRSPSFRALLLAAVGCVVLHPRGDAHPVFIGGLRRPHCGTSGLLQVRSPSLGGGSVRGLGGATALGAAAADDDERVAAGDFVTVEYTARLESGVVVDSSDAEEGAPLKFVAGSNSVLRGLSDGVIGLALRDLTKLELEPAVAYGERDETRVMKVPSQNLPAGAAVGSQIMVAAPGAAAQKGSGTPAVIRDLGGDDGVATIDLNHPLAGQRLLFDLVVTSRKEPRSVASGDFVSVQYRAMLTEADGGGVVDASTPGTPLEFVAGGDGAVLPGLAKRVVGLAVGVRTELLLEPEEAFGQRDPSNVAEVPRSQMPEGELNVGARLKLQVEGGETPAIISEVTDEVVRLDLNSPLAGKQLLFDVEIVNLVPQDRVDDLGGGLIMETKTPGDGVSRPQPGQTVLLHFVGLLQDGSVFRSTVEEGAPVRITLEGTRACNMGLDVAASRMSVGQRTILRVPSSRAYGSEGSEDGKVPADADLRFFLELAAIE